MPGTRLDVAESRRQGRCSPGRASLSGQAWAAGHRKALWENRLMTGVREQPSAAVFVFAVAVVFHLRPNDFPKLEMWLFTPKAAISHPHPSPHTHTHAHTLNVEISQALKSVLPPTYFPLSPPPDPWRVLDLASLLSTGTTPTSAIPTIRCYGVGVCKRCGCV